MGAIAVGGKLKIASPCDCSLACRCALKARKEGYKMIGLQFYGECWSSTNSLSTYKADGPATTCIQNYNEKCDKKADHLCVGELNTNYVYRLVEGKHSTRYDVCFFFFSMSFFKVTRSKSKVRSSVSWAQLRYGKLRVITFMLFTRLQ